MELYVIELQVIMPRAGAAAELELYPVQVKLLRYQLSGQRQPNANMFAGMVGSIGGIMSSKQANVVVVVLCCDSLVFIITFTTVLLVRLVLVLRGCFLLFCCCNC